MISYTEPLVMYDGMTERKKIKYIIKDQECGWNQLPNCCITNPPGEITDDAFKAITDSFLRLYSLGCPYMIEINGEEDLLALPYILFVDTPAIVLWGNPFEKCTEGVMVSHQLKLKVLGMMNKYGEWE